MNNSPINMVLNKNFNLESLREKNVYWELEHNIVSEDAINSVWSIENAFKSQGNVKEIYKNKNYLVVINDIQSYRDADYVINYSELNIEHIRLSNKLDSHMLNKMLYLPPLMFDIDFNRNKARTNSVITTFRNTNVPLRRDLLNNLKSSNIEFKNFNNVFCEHKLRELYDNSKILINIHQTPYHHTLEEIRILPALSRGMVVISEISPLSDMLPYSDYIIWTTYDDVIQTVKDTIKNYASIYKAIFINKSPSLYRVLNDLNEQSLNTLYSKISET